MDATRRRRRRDEDGERPSVPGYEVLAPIGFGACGPVWSARDASGGPVVVAVLDLPSGERGAALLRRLRTLRATTHPHLATVRDVRGLPGDRCALISEEVPGPALTTVHAAGGDLSASAGTLLRALGSALGHLHGKGVVHGDVAPGNVIIAPGGVPVLVDLAGEPAREAGTPGFVAPERRDGATATRAGDVWALARLVLWASGEDPEVGQALEPALAADPVSRPAALDLAQRGRGLGEAPLPLADGADLAQARLRDEATTTRLAPARRARGRHRGGRSRRGLVAVVGGIVVAVVLGAGVLSGPERTGPEPGPGPGPVAGEPVRILTTSPGPPAGAGVPGEAGSGAPGEPGSEAPAAEVVAVEDVEAAVTGLLADRDEALAALDGERLARLTVPGTPPAEDDVTLLAALRERGLRPEGLRTELHEVRPPRTPPRDGSQDEEGFRVAEGLLRVEVVTRQGAHRLATADGTGGAEGAGDPGGADSARDPGGAAGAGDGARETDQTADASVREVPAQGPRCTLMALERQEADADGPRWRLAAAGPCR